MHSKWSKTIVIGFAALLVLAIGVVSVFAQTTPATPVPDDSTAVPQMPGFHGRGGFDGFGHGGDNQAELAAALGITVEELQAAQAKAAAARIAQAVEDGYLTQDQANLMLAEQALRGVIDHQAIMAETFGLTVEELQTAMQDGTLRDLMANITPADLQAKMQAAYTAAVQQAVTDNVITQEQADLVLAQMANHMGLGFGFGPMGHGHGGHGFYGGQRGFDGDDALGGTYAPNGAFQHVLPSTGA
jgi:hypothetical protein